jgi:hypothetical protein
MMVESRNLTLDRFTEEARKIVNTYLDDVRNALHDTELTEEEINESLDELKEHIISYCHLKSEQDEIITTDKVKNAMKKLGEPKVIAETLQGELNFNYEVKNEVLGANHTSFSRPSGPQYLYQFHFRAKHLVALYMVLNWVLTLIMFFLVFGLHEALQYYPWFYGFSVLCHYGLQNTKWVKINSYLRDNLKLSNHLMFTPFIYVVFSLIYYRSFSDFPILVPPVITIWLFISTTKSGREFYEEIYRKM